MQSFQLDHLISYVMNALGPLSTTIKSLLTYNQLKLQIFFYFEIKNDYISNQNVVSK